ncbi:MAG: preprotein translocase subunit SecG [Bilophila wadsworthia]
MQTLILSLHVIVCVTLVILVLLQAGKEGMGVIFGGGNASVFGSSGAGGLLAKMTLSGGTDIIRVSYNYVSSSTKRRNPPFLTSVWRFPKTCRSRCWFPQLLLKSPLRLRCRLARQLSIIQSMLLRP